MCKNPKRMNEVKHVEIEGFGEYENLMRKAGDGTKIAETTQNNYRSCLTKFCDFHDKNPHELIEEAYYSKNEEGKDPWLQKNPAEERISRYYEHLITPKDKGGRGVSKVTGASRFRILKAFYEKNGVKVDIQSPTPPTPENEVLRELDRFDVRKLVYSAPKPRDQAIVLIAFQSGMNTKDICFLNYGDYEKGRKLKEKHDFNCLPITKTRAKTKIGHTTFLGSDTIEILETYLDERRRKGEELDNDSPLFAKHKRKKDRVDEKGDPVYEWKPERIEPRHIQKMMRETAERAGFEQEKGTANKYSLKNLRDAFSSILKSKGANDVMVEHWMGHAPPYNGAYHHLRLEDMATEYEENQQYLSITGAEERTDRRIEDLHAKLGEKEERISSLESEVGDARSELENIRGELEEQGEMIAGFEDEVIENPDLLKDMQRFEEIIKIMNENPDLMEKARKRSS